MAKSLTKRRNPTASLALTWGGVTDPGRVRSVNQDAYFADADKGLFIVSDGIGGGQAGALASEVVVRVLPAIIQQRLAGLKGNSTPAIRTQLRHAICELSQKLSAESAAQIELRGMGATLVVALLGRRSVHLAHLGDSRAYVFRRRRLLQLTNDHSVVGILLRQGEITPEQAHSHPAQGRLSRFVGMEGEVLPDVKTVGLKKGDQLLLCSDGLTGMLSDNQVASVISTNLECQETCQRLADAANANGGRDNITAVLLRWR
jgi:PPM family protein phosphatase